MKIGKSGDCHNRRNSDHPTRPGRHDIERQMHDDVIGAPPSNRSVFGNVNSEEIVPQLGDPPTPAEYEALESAPPLSSPPLTHQISINALK